MITGRVTSDGLNLRPIIAFPICVENGPLVPIEATVDTGFTGYLTLSKETVEFLDLEPVSDQVMTLADGSKALFLVYRAVVEWFGTHRLIDVHRAEGDSLVGMAMLQNHNLHIQAVLDGDVSIAPIG